MARRYAVTPAVIDANRRTAQKRARDLREHPPSELFNPEAPLPQETDFLQVDVAKTMQEFVGMVGKPNTWSDIKVYETVKGEIYRNLSAARDAAIQGRKLFTSAQVKARDERWNKAAHDRIDIVERLMDSVPNLNPEQRAAFLERAREWRLETMRQLAAING